jgi:septal ring-binding cell division protein DamX
MLEGEIREIELVPRLIELWREKFTGAIRFEHDGIIKIIYFKEGDVISASTNDRADSVDEILMRAGKVSREHVKQALAKRKENETLGDALLTLGFITRKELTWARRIQVIGVIRSVSEWQAGTYTIVSDYLPKREEGTIFPLPQLIVELIVTDPDRQKYERLLESGSAVFEKAVTFDESFPGLGLNEDAEAVVKNVDGSRTAAEVASASRQEPFNAFKLIHALTVLGLLRRHQAIAVPEPAMAFEDAGAVNDAAELWSAPPPQFELDDAPPLSITATPNEVAMEAPAPPSPAAPAPRRTVSTPMPPAKRTTVAAAKKKPEPPTQSRFGLIVTLIVLFILAGAGYFGWQWWNGRQSGEAVAAPLPVRPAPRPVVTQTVAPPPTPVPEPAPAPPTQTIAPIPPTSPYEAMARDFARNPSGNFTIQFAIVCEPSNVAKALNNGGKSVWFVPITIKGRSCYRMFWGRYDTREAGERNLANLPASLRESRPAVVTIPR